MTLSQNLCKYGQMKGVIFSPSSIANRLSAERLFCIGIAHFFGAVSVGNIL